MAAVATVCNGIIAVCGAIVVAICGVYVDHVTDVVTVIIIVVSTGGAVVVVVVAVVIVVVSVSIVVVTRRRQTLEMARPTNPWRSFPVFTTTSWQ